MWAFAFHMLKHADDGTKLRRNANLLASNELICREDKGDKRYLASFERCPLIVSFIKIHGQIYALLPGEPIGEGVTAKVKLAINEQGAHCLVRVTHKIQTCSSANGSEVGDDIKANDEQNRVKEIAYLDDLGQLIAHTVRKDAKNHYMVIHDLGRMLQVYLFAQNKHDDSTRLTLAACLCWLVHCLHHGYLSKTRTPYAHLDLKHSNITVCHHGRLHLIDFGFSEQHIKETLLWIKGSFPYLPPNCLEFSKQALDTIALKRILWLPKTFNAVNRVNKTVIVKDFNRPKSYRSILSDEQVSKHHLLPFLNTATSNDIARSEHVSPLRLALVLVLRISSLDSLLPTLNAANVRQLEALMVLFFANCLSQYYKRVMTDHNWCNKLHMLALYAYYFESDLMKSIVNSEALLDAFLNSSLSILESKAINKFYQSYVRDESLAEVIASSDYRRVLIESYRLGLFNSVPIMLRFSRADKLSTAFRELDDAVTEQRLRGKAKRLLLMHELFDKTTETLLIDGSGFSKLVVTVGDRADALRPLVASSRRVIGELSDTEGLIEAYLASPDKPLFLVLVNYCLNEYDTPKRSLHLYQEITSLIIYCEVLKNLPTVYQGLIDNIYQLAMNDINTQQFKHDSHILIDKARHNRRIIEALKMSLGILIEGLIMLCSLIVFYPQVRKAMSVWSGHNYTFFSSHRRQLDNLDEKISQHARFFQF